MAYKEFELGGSSLRKNSPSRKPKNRLKFWLTRRTIFILLLAMNQREAEFP